MLPGPDRWHELDRRLTTLLELDSAGRAAELDSLRCDDPELAGDLEALLAGLQPSEVLERVNCAPLLGDALAALPGVGAGDVLGEWRLQRRIGTGGMSEIHLACREHNAIRQVAALKLMAHGLSSPLMRSRFLDECRCLARLSDPRIARYYDSGVAEDGRPWMAMELVDGVPLDAYLQSQRPPLGQRVELVVDIAGAVAHAHTHLIAHHDLKPSNVLVTGDGQVKLLDFGIASLLDGSIDDGQAGAPRMLTPEFASPEQLTGGPLGVASDIYQLGRLLALAIIGRRVAPTPVSSAGAMPPAPDAAAPEPTSATMQRLAMPRADVARVRGDLDAIVARATAQDAGDRYDSVQALRADLQAWRQDRPVAARPLGRLHRIARVLARHRIATAMTSAAVVVGGVLCIAWLEQTARANREASTTQAVHGLLASALHAGHYDAEPREDESVSKLLDEVERLAPDTLSVRPDALAQTWLMIAHARAARGEFQRASDLLREAAGLPGLAPALRQQIELALSTTLHYSGHYTEARRIAEAQLAEMEARHGMGDARTFPVLAELTDLNHSLGDYAQARAHGVQLLAIAKAGRREGDLARAHRLLGMVLRDRGEFDAARAQLASALEIDRRLLGDEHVNVAAGLDHLGLLDLHQGNLEAAERSLREAHAIRVRLFQPGMLGRVWTEHRRAQLRLLEGDAATARDELKRVVQVYARELGESSHITALARTDLAWAQLVEGDWEAASRELVHADAVLETLAQGAHPRRSQIQLGLAVAAVAEGDFDSARDHATLAHTLVRHVVEEGHPARATSCQLLRQIGGECSDPAPPVHERALIASQLALALARLPA